MNANIENQRMLASLVGINEDEAAERLEAAVKITCSSAAQPLADELREQLERTVRITGAGDRVDLEVVIDSAHLKESTLGSLSEEIRTN